MKLLVLSGGRHPYEESTPVLRQFLEDHGHDVTVTDNPDILSDEGRMRTHDALVFNTLREGDLALSVEEQQGMKEFIGSGHGFVCIHISGCVPDSWHEYGDITGGGWVMGQSFHPPYGKFTANVVDKSHPGVAGISDFTTNDELYMNIDYRDGNDVFMSAEFEGGVLPKNRVDGEPMDMPGGTFPLGWTRNYGGGKVFVTLLGHNGLSFNTPEFQRMILNGVDWVTKTPK